MDVRSIFSASFIFSRLSKAIPWRRKTDEAPTSATAIKSAQGVLLVICGLTLAWTAHEISSEYAREQQLSTHWPSINLWHSLLKSEGFAPLPLQDNTWLIEKNPAAYSNAQEIWLTDDRQTLFIPESFYKKNSPEIWSRASFTGTRMRGRIAPLNWIHLGSGIKAIEKLIEFLTEAPTQHTPNQKKMGIAIDPKEIRY